MQKGKRRKMKVYAQVWMDDIYNVTIYADKNASDADIEKSVLNAVWDNINIKIDKERTFAEAIKDGNAFIRGDKG